MWDLMDAIWKTLNYLANLQWTEKKQHDCLFCNETNFNAIVYKDDRVIAVNNLRCAGDAHWLIMPRRTHERHVRDIEALTVSDLELLQAMDDVKKTLLRRHFPHVAPRDVHAGYHRGRRSWLAGIILPDIVSIHHLHLHVIVRPRPMLKFFKYASWLPWIWVSDMSVLDRLLLAESPRKDIRD